MRPEETAMSVRLDHANLCVRDVEGMVRFLTAAFPGFRVRGGGPDCAGHAWTHVGDDESYLSLLAALRERLRAAGSRETTVPNAHPHRRRAYFADAEGNGWELVERRSQGPAERNDDALEDRT
jgi:catechol 2,3-dioxygenase-like lactoylglutathione lyase family enzyme